MDNFLQDILGGIIKVNLIPSGPAGTTTRFVLNLLTNGLILLFTGIIIVAIVYSALAGLKYIRSQGEAEKIEEAQNALKAVFIGVAAVFVGIIGVILISGIFVNQGATEVRRAICSFIEPNVSVNSCVAGSAQ